MTLRHKQSSLVPLMARITVRLRHGPDVLTYVASLMNYYRASNTSMSALPAAGWRCRHLHAGGING